VERVRAMLVRLGQRFAWRCKIARLERQHARGYARRTVLLGEFDVWESEQAWGEE